MFMVNTNGIFFEICLEDLVIILLFVFNYKHRLILLRTRFEFTQLVNYLETTVSHILNNVMKYLKTSYQFNPSTVNRLLLLKLLTRSCNI